MQAGFPSISVYVRSPVHFEHFFCYGLYTVSIGQLKQIFKFETGVSSGHLMHADLSVSIIEPYSQYSQASRFIL